jgi:DNA segregation ATPase FtsK/SpoIIIE, S-DNA-T family
MPRVLSVSEIRKQLYWAAGGPQAAGQGEPTTALLGSLFHQLFGQLTGPDAQVNLTAPLQLADATLDSWQRTLATHAYHSFVAPALSTHQAALQANSAEVIAFWTAVKGLCDWLAAVLFEQRSEDESLENIRARIFRSAEHEVCAELSDPAWSDSVIVQGRADCIVGQRGTAHRCVVELKLGRTAPEADLLQACLYHLLLTVAGEQSASHLALMVFEPGRGEHLFEAGELQNAQAKLKALIWRLASEVPPTATVSAQRKPPGPVSAADLATLGKTLENAFSEFGASIELEGTPLTGPSFIRFFAKPRRGVNVRTLTRLGQSVWMRLSTAEPPQIALERGRITIDVENPQRQSVEFAHQRHALPPRDQAGVSRFAVGVAVDGHLHFADLARPESAHFLVAGTSGSGKSEWLRAALASLMVSNGVDTLRLALIDPKRSAFSSLGRSPYLWRPLIFSEGIAELFSELVTEMERRYEVFSRQRADNLAEYNATQSPPLPRIICVCDEYADLLLADKKRRAPLENLIARLGSKARAAGIHLIFATQRPSRDIVKGVIDANFSGRVALKVARPIESRLILDEAGAASLLGRGDLLYKDIGNPVRLQGLFVTRGEMEELVAGA